MSAVGTPHQSWIHPQTSIGDGVQLGSGVIINKPSIIRAGAELSRVVCSSAVDLNGSLANGGLPRTGCYPLHRTKITVILSVPPFSFATSINPVTGFFEVRSFEQNTFHAFVGDHPRQPVRAEEKNITLFDSVF